MNSEKVKEIKKALKFCCGECDCDCPYYKNGKSYEECKSLLLFEALTLINELESENKWLVGKVKEKVNEMTTYTVNNQKLKDRIAELEKENAKLLDSVETVQSNRCVYKCVLTKEHLTKFAERIKELAKQFGVEIKEN